MPEKKTPASPFARPGATTAYDEGLRAHMLRIYNYMASALILTGIVALFSASSETVLNAMYVIADNHIVGMKPLAWVAMLAPLAMVLFLSFGVQRMSLFATQASYWIYAALMGLSLSTIFLTFTGDSIARVFFITAGTFGGMSLYGYTTQRDLTGFGSFLFMGLIGIILAALVNLFIKSSALQFAVSVIGVLIFVGLTAYDTQRLKDMYNQQAASPEWVGKMAVMGALSLYLDFINIFVNLLYLFGNRRN